MYLHILHVHKLLFTYDEHYVILIFTTTTKPTATLY